MMNSRAAQSVVLFDGVCNLCNGLVQFIIRRDPAKKFLFAPLQSEAAAKLVAPFSIPAKELNSLVLLEDGKIYLRARAVLRITRRLKGFWKLTAALYIVPPFLSNSVYNLIAKYRYRIFGKRNECMMPDAAIKSRFLL